MKRLGIWSVIWFIFISCALGQDSETRYAQISDSDGISFIAPFAIPREFPLHFNFLTATEAEISVSDSSGAPVITPIDITVNGISIERTCTVYLPASGIYVVREKLKLTMTPDSPFFGGLFIIKGDTDLEWNFDAPKAGVYRLIVSVGVSNFQMDVSGDFSLSSIGSIGPPVPIILVSTRNIKAGEKIEFTISYKADFEDTTTVHALEHEREATFPDENLEMVIRRIIGKSEGTIYESDLEGITNLDAPGRNIADLSGIEHCSDLEVINLYHNKVSDLTPISNLTKLRELDLSFNQIEDLMPLAELPDLERIDLSGNRISDISVLAVNPGLGEGDEIDLRGNPLSRDTYKNIIPILESKGVNLLYDAKKIYFVDPNLEAVMREALGEPDGPIYDFDLMELEKLYAAQRDITDLNGIENCGRLKVLNLCDNQISDLTPLSRLSNLEELNLSNNRISDLTPISNLSELRELDLSFNRIEGVWPLVNLSNLSWLSLRDNQIGYIQALVENSGLGEGDEIDLRDNPLSNETYDVHIPILRLRGVSLIYDPRHEVQFADPNLEVVIRKTIGKPDGAIYNSDLLELRILLADREDITDLSGIEYCKNLNLLALNGNRISDIGPLGGLTKLRDLNLSNNRIVDINPLSGLIQLNNLNLSDNRISDISPLSNLTELYGLYLSNNRISDVNPLSNLVNLEGLGLSCNQISDVSPLSGLTLLSYLDLSNNRIEDISALVNNPSLGHAEIDLRGNPLSFHSINDLIPQLSERGADVLYDMPRNLWGDVSGNGKITAYDASLILRYLAGKISQDDLNLDLADVTGDGEVTTLDVAYILMFIIGRITEFPVRNGLGASSSGLHNHPKQK